MRKQRRRLVAKTAAPPIRRVHVNRTVLRAALLGSTALVGVAFSVGQAAAQNVDVNTAAELQLAIQGVDDGTYNSITITGNITLSSGASNELDAITKAVTINGGGFTITGPGGGAGGFGVFFVNAGSGAAVNIINLNINDGYAKGGTGAGGAGGGLGAGGAIFAMSGAITLTNVGFSGNQAVGGNGGASAAIGGGGGLNGGQGGLGGAYGQNATAGGGGGGIGLGATGGDATASHTCGPSQCGGSNGYGGIVTGAGGGGSGSSGGAGGTAGGGGGGGGSGGGGGGGIGGGGGGSYGIGSSGGNGGFGGGGGGLFSEFASRAGNGGFGGGGGNGAYANNSHSGSGYVRGGNGGFGGGGGEGTGYASNIGGSGGYGAGKGGSNIGGTGGTGGGGGAGLGGSIFVCTGAVSSSCSATLTITNTSNQTINGTANGGSGYQNGQGIGGAMFLSGGTTNFGGSATTQVTTSIAGGGGIGVTGGELELEAANSYQGGTSVSGGTLLLTSGSTLGSTSGTLSVSAGTLNLGGTTQTTGALTFTGGTIENGTLDASSFGVQAGTITATLGGSGSLTKSGSGTFILSGDNSYSGGTTVSGGTLELTSNNAAGTGTITLDAGTTLNLDGVHITNHVSVSSVSGDPDITVTGANSMGALSGTSTATTNILGTDNSATTDVLTLTTANSTYAGTTNVGGTSAGSSVTLQAGAVNAFGSTSTVSIYTGSVLDLGGYNQTIGSLSGAGTVTNSGTSSPAVLTVSGGTSSTFSGSLDNGTSTLGLTISGAGTNLTLTGTNDYSGATTVESGGTLTVGSNSEFGNTSGLTLNDGTLVASGSFTLQTTLTIQGNGTLSADTGDKLTIAQAVTGSGVALTIGGSGTVDLTSTANSYSGATTITSGATLAAGATNAFSANSAMSDNGTLDLGGFNQTILSLAGAGTVTNSGASGTATLTIDGGASTTFSGTIQNGTSATTALTLTGAGTDLTLSGTNTYSGATTIGNGTNASVLKGGATDSFSANSAFTVNAASTLDLGGFSQTIGSLSGAGTVTNSGASGTATLTIGGGTSTAFSGTIENGTNAQTALTLSGSGTDLTLTGTNTYSGATTIGAGATLAAGATNAFSATSAVSDIGTLDLGSVSQTVASLSGTGTVTNLTNPMSVSTPATATLTISNGGTFGGTIVDGTVSGVTTGLNLTGGTLTLTNGGGNTYSGATTIGNGTNASVLKGGATDSFSANSAFTVNAAGTLDLGGFDQTILSLAGAGTVTNSGASGTNTLTINGGTSTTFSGTIENGTNAQTALTLSGAGTDLTLTGTNTYSGATTIGAGATLTAGAANELSATSAVSDSGTLDLGSLSQSVASLSGTGTVTNLTNPTSVSTPATATLTISNGGTFGGTIVDGTVSGVTTGLNLTGGTLTLTNGGGNTYSGATTIGNGTSASVLQGGATDAFSANSAFTVNAASTLDLGGFDQTILSLAGAGTVTNSGASGTATLTIDGGTSTTFSGTIENGTNAQTALTLSGTNTSLTLSGSNSYGGASTIDTGATLALSGSGSVSDSSVVTANGTFDVSNVASNTAITSLAGSGSVSLGGNVLRITDASTTFSGVISDGGNFGGIDISGGTQTLSGVNTYLNATEIDAGATLALKGNGSIADSASVTLVGGTFDISQTNDGTFISALYGTSGTVSLGAQTLTITSGSFFDGVIADGGIGGGTGGGLTIAGTSADQQLGGVNTYTGLTTINATDELDLISSGTHSANNGSIADSSAVIDNGIFDISGLGKNGTVPTSTSITSLSGTNSAAFVNLGENTLTITNASGTFAGVIEDGGISGGRGGKLAVSGGTETLTGANTYTGGTTLDDGTLVVGNDSALGTGTLTMAAGTTLSFTNAGNFTIDNAITIAGDPDFSPPAGTTQTIAGVIADGVSQGTLNMTGAGTLVLSADNTYTGPTEVTSGTLDVSGSIADSSLVTVASGAALTGAGTVGNLQVSGIFAPGSGTPGTGMAVSGSLAFESAAIYLVQINPTTASLATVTGTASLAGTVNAVFANGGYIAKVYTILSAASVTGTFTSLVNTNLPNNFHDSLSYDRTHVYLDLALNFQTPPAGTLNDNQKSVANALTYYFNSTGGIPMKYATLPASALTQSDGEDATGAAHGAFDLMNEFLGLMLDPFVDGRGNSTAPASGGALGFAPAEQAAEPFDLTPALDSAAKAPPQQTFDQRWSAWSAGFGGNATNNGNLTVGSNNVSTSTYGYAGGMDYHYSPDTLFGFALAGGGTGWSLAQELGSGRSDAFQAGIYGKSYSGSAYLSGALAFGNNWFTTNRTALGDQLTASFTGQSFAARGEAGYRYAVPMANAVIGVTPYGALQTQWFHTPTYSETDVVDGGFGLTYGANTANDTRSELGARFDNLTTLDNTPLVLRARLAWAHDWTGDTAANAVFEALPGATFAVNGAAVPHDSALSSASAQYFFTADLSFIAKFDGEFSPTSQSYAGSGTLKYTW